MLRTSDTANGGVRRKPRPVKNDRAACTRNSRSLPASQTAKRKPAPDGYVPLFSQVPREFALKAAKHKLSGFEIALLLGLLSLAKRSAKERRHQLSLKAGRAKVRLLKRQSSDGFPHKTARTAARKRIYFGDDGEGSIFTRTAQNGYDRAQRKLAREAPPDFICVCIPNASSLLRAAGLSDDSRNRQRVPDVVEKLTSTIVRNAPLVRSARNARYPIEIFMNPVWLAPPFVNVPLPLPVKSTLACQLTLLLRCMDLNDEQQMIKTSKLYELLGIDRMPRAKQAFGRAMNLVNKHCLSFNISKRNSLTSRGVDAPFVYEVEAVARGRVRFVSGKPSADMWERTIDLPGSERGAIDDIDLEDWRAGARARNTLTG